MTRFGLTDCPSRKTKMGLHPPTASDRSRSQQSVPGTMGRQTPAPPIPDRHSLLMELSQAARVYYSECQPAGITIFAGYLARALPTVKQTSGPNNHGEIDMTVLNVGPGSDFATIAAAMSAAGPGDTIHLESGYSNETATISYSGMTIFGGANSRGIVLNLGVGIATVTMTGTAPFQLHDASDGNGIVGNAGNNRIFVTGGVDAVDGGLGIDRLVVDYRHATGAVTGDSTSNFTEAGGGGRTVTVTDGTFEHFTIITGSGADTITTGAGNDIINTHQGASTVSAGQGANIILGGANADTITALDGGNSVYAGGGTNTVTTGGGRDNIFTGTGSDTIVSGGGTDHIHLSGGADSVDAGSGDDRLIINYSAMTSNVSGGITGGNGVSGYVGHIADLLGSSVDFQRSESFTITTGRGNDRIATGNGADVLHGNGGDDVFFGGGGRDQLFGGAGRDQLNGGAGQDLIFAGFGNDLLRGGDGDDLMFGGGGNDLLRGGLGNDATSGGAGADVFIFFSVREASNSHGHDVIRDFEVGTDHINLASIDANWNLAGDQAFHFIGSAQFSSVAGELRYGEGMITGDNNGDGQADFTIEVGVGLALTHYDFVL
ncbi:MAG: calcium-binding protein [Cypionkella sp.]